MKESTRRGKLPNKREEDTEIADAGPNQRKLGATSPHAIVKAEEIEPSLKSQYQGYIVSKVGKARTLFYGLIEFNNLCIRAFSSCQ